MNEKNVLKCEFCGEVIVQDYNDTEELYWISKNLFPDKPPICDGCIFDILMEMEEASIEFEKTHKKLDVNSKADEHEKIKLGKTIDIFNKCNETVRNQDAQLKKLISIIKHNHTAKNVNTKINVMMIGLTGTGKTLIAKTISEVMGIPYVIENATEFTEAGYYGRDVEEMIVDLYQASNYDLEKTQRGIIFIDEIDKKEAGEGGRDVSGAKVIESLLTMMQGSKIMVFDENDAEYYKIDTSFITFVCMGVFPNLDKVRNKRLNNSGSIGFADETKVSGISKEYITSDFEKIGFNSQFIARFGKIIELNNHTKDSLRDIICNSKAAGVTPWVDEFSVNNITLEIEDEVIGKIVDKAIALKSGARGISRELNEVLIDILMDIVDNQETEKKCILDMNTFENPLQYTLI